MDYTTYETVTTTSQADAGATAGVTLVLLLIYIAVIVFMIVAMWKLFKKAGKPGWASIVPIYNTIVMLEMVGRPLWWIVLLLIPFVNIVFAIIITHDMAKAFGKDVAWTLGLIFLPIIFYPILAFGKSEYVGPGGMHHPQPQAPQMPQAPTPPAAPTPAM